MKMSGGAKWDRTAELLAARQKYMSRNVPFSCRYSRKIDNLRNFLSECVDFEKKVTKRRTKNLVMKVVLRMTTFLLLIFGSRYHNLCVKNTGPRALGVSCDNGLFFIRKNQLGLSVI